MSKTAIKAATNENNDEVYKLIVKIRDKDPDLMDVVALLLGHYERITPANPYLLSKRRLAAMVYLDSDRYIDALREISKKLGFFLEASERFLLETINRGPDEWLKDKEYFEQKGLIRGLEEYYPANASLGPNSDFQKLRERIDPAYHAILLAAIDCTYSNKKGLTITLQQRELIYVAAQLALQGAEKESFFAALSQKDVRSNSYAYAVKKSQTAIVDISQALGIDINAIEFVTASVPEKETKVKPHRNGTPTAQSAKRTGPNLSSQLGWLKQRGELTPAEEKAYLTILRKKEEGRIPSTMEIQSLLTTGGARISFSDAASFEKRIESSLEVLRNDITRNPFRFQIR